MKRKIWKKNSQDFVSVIVKSGSHLSAPSLEQKEWWRVGFCPGRKHILQEFPQLRGKWGKGSFWPAGEKENKRETEIPEPSPPLVLNICKDTRTSLKDISSAALSSTQFFANWGKKGTQKCWVQRSHCWCHCGDPLSTQQQPCDTPTFLWCRDCFKYNSNILIYNLHYNSKVWHWSLAGNSAMWNTSEVLKMRQRAQHILEFSKSLKKF